MDDAEGWCRNYSERRIDCSGSTTSLLVGSCARSSGLAGNHRIRPALGRTGGHDGRGNRNMVHLAPMDNAKALIIGFTDE